MTEPDSTAPVEGQDTQPEPVPAEQTGVEHSDNPIVEADANPVEPDSPYPGTDVDAAAARGEQVTTVHTENVDDSGTGDHNDAGPAVQGDAPLVEDTSNGIPDAVQAVSEGDEGVHAGEVSAGATPLEDAPVHEQNFAEYQAARAKAWEAAVLAAQPPALPEGEEPIRLTADVVELYVNQYFLTAAEAEQVVLARVEPHSDAEKSLVERLKSERTGGLSHPLTQYEARLRARDNHVEA